MNTTESDNWVNSTIAPSLLTPNETLEQEYGHRLSYQFTIVVAMYFIFLTVTGIGCNTLLMYTILSRYKLRSVANAFIINLAICDFITGAVNLPQDATFLLQGYYKGNVISCGFKEIVFFFSLPSSVANLLLLTLDRCIKIVYPFRHQELISTCRVIVLISTVWVYTLIVALFPIIYDPNAIHVEHGGCWMNFPWAYIYYTVSANFIVPLILIIVLNVILFVKAQKHTSAIKEQTSRQCSVKARLRTKGTAPSVVVNIKAAKTILLMVGVFLVCWLTFISLAFHNLLCGMCHPREVTWVGNCINYSSITLNPILYGLLNRPIRKELRKIFCMNNSSQKKFYSSRTQREHLFSNS